MELTNANTIKLILHANKALAKKSFGQHFLVDRKILDKIVESAGLDEPDRNRQILEIGPGIGVLTEELIKKAGKIIAVEADHDMVGILQKITDNPSNLTIVPAPIQQFRRHEYFAEGKFDIVANLPYNVSSYVLNDYLQNSPRPRQIIVMVQKEVALRAVAKPGDTNRGLLSLIVEIFSTKAEIVEIVPSSAFWPEPKVESAILRIIVNPNVETQGIASVQSILKIAKIAFSQRRKKIANSLPTETRHGVSLRAGIDLNLRPQDLTLEQWKTISTL